MSKKLLVIALGSIILIGLGFFFLKAPTPEISIKAETIFEIGPIPIKNTMIAAWTAILLLAGLFYIGTKRMELVPRGLQNLLEVIVEMVRNLIFTTAGEKNGRRFFPVVATFFIYVAFVNWFALMPFFNAFGKVEPLEPEGEEFREKAAVMTSVAGVSFILPGAKEVELTVDESACANVPEDEKEECLVGPREQAIEEARHEAGLSEDKTLGVILPYFRSVNTDLMSTLALALISAVFVEYMGISSLGFFKYGSRFFNVRKLLKGKILFGVIDFAVGVLELVAEFARLISFSFRLFGNLLAGEIVLLFMTFLIPLLLAVPFYALEILVGGIQALIFGMLTLVFATTAVASHEEH